MAAVSHKDAEDMECLPCEEQIGTDISFQAPNEFMYTLQSLSCIGHSSKDV